MSKEDALMNVGLMKVELELRGKKWYRLKRCHEVQWKRCMAWSNKSSVTLSQMYSELLIIKELERRIKAQSKAA